MTLDTIPDAEAIIGKHLRDHPDIEALDARVAGKTPNSTVKPWIRVRELDTRNASNSKAEHLLNYLVQLDCYAGEEAMTEHTGQAEAKQVCLAARAVLIDMPEQSFQGVVVTATTVTHAHIPDSDFEPERERYVISAQIWMHA